MRIPEMHWTGPAALTLTVQFDQADDSSDIALEAAAAIYQELEPTAPPVTFEIDQPQSRLQPGPDVQHDEPEARRAQDAHDHQVLGGDP